MYSFLWMDNVPFYIYIYMCVYIYIYVCMYVSQLCYPFIICDNLEGWDRVGGGREIQEGGTICIPIVVSC